MLHAPMSFTVQCSQLFLDITVSWRLASATMGTSAENYSSQNLKVQQDHFIYSVQPVEQNECVDQLNSFFKNQFFAIIHSPSDPCACSLTTKYLPPFSVPLCSDLSLYWALMGMAEALTFISGSFLYLLGTRCSSRSGGGFRKHCSLWPLSMNHKHVIH